MRILLSNDDGYLAPGLKSLKQAAERFATEVVVVAPDRDRSGASNSLTLRNPLRVTEVSTNFYYLDGTPTDCVHVALTGMLAAHELPDMVLAGINSGANMGDDVLYSGTVAAATEGRFLGLPAIAFSMADMRGSGAPGGHQIKHFDTGEWVVENVLTRLQSRALEPDTILNVNIPDVPLDQIKGFAATRLGHRHKSEPVVKAQDPAGREIYWVGPAGAEQDAGPGTDFYAVKNLLVSVTPLQIDLTRHNAITGIETWLQKTGR